MCGRWTTILISFLAGLLGGTVPRLFTEPVAFAQNRDVAAKKYAEVPVPVSKIVRAERFELVNNKGKALAVLETLYGEAMPAGAAMLTFTDRDELMGQDRKVVLTTARLSMSIGKDDYLYMGPGGSLSFHDATGGVAIGKTTMPSRPSTIENGVVIYSQDGITMENTTVWRWVQRYAPILDQRCRRELKPTGITISINTSFPLPAMARWQFFRMGTPRPLRRIHRRYDRDR